MLCPLLGLFALGDVAENEHHAHGVAVPVSYGSAAVVDGDLCSVFPHEDRMVGKTDNHPFPEHLGDGALNLTAGLLVDDIEDLRDRLHRSLRERPAGQSFRDSVHKGDLSFNVGGNDRIADARQGGGPALLAFPKGGLLLNQGLCHAVECASHFSKLAAFHDGRHMNGIRTRSQLLGLPPSASWQGSR